MTIPFTLIEEVEEATRITKDSERLKIASLRLHLHLKMRKVSFPVLCSFSIAAMVLLCSAADPVGKHWPDLSCHESLENDWRAKYPAEHKETWKGCQIRNNETGQCAKTCMLRERGILYERRRWQSDPSKKSVCYNPNEATAYFTTELGLKFPENMKEGPEKSAVRKRIQEIGDKIDDALDVCIKHFGNTFWERHIRGPCSEWADLLDCLDKAYGCSSSEFKHK